METFEAAILIITFSCIGVLALFAIITAIITLHGLNPNRKSNTVTARTRQ